MEELAGYSNKCLDIDLSQKRLGEFEISPRDRELYLGGKGLALKLLVDRLKPGVDPLSEENILIFMTGVLTGTGAPCSSRFAAAAKSPLTNIITTSSCGGPFGIALRTAGYDGVVIRGKSEVPVYIIMSASGVSFQDARPFWGQDTETIQEMLAPGSRDGALAIGPAGENKALFASIASGHRFFGRGGLGAVMGSKNLKAILARGGAYRVVPVKKQAFDKARKLANQKINANDFTGQKYRKFGTAANFNYCNAGKILPVMNFKQGSHEAVRIVSGEAMREAYNSKPNPCKSCSILCGHKGIMADGGEYAIPEYETAALFGPNLGIFDTDAVVRWNRLCNRMGLDTISTAVTLSYTMEATEKGLLRSDLKFGSSEGIESMIIDIAHRKGLGDELANGTRWLSEKYGGKEFAMHVKGMELAAYDPRGAFGQGLSYAVANRGACHLESSVFVTESFMGFMNPHSTKSKARIVKFFETLNTLINSLDICQFTAYAFVLEGLVVKHTPKPILGWAMTTFSGLAVQFIDIGLFKNLVNAASGLSLSRRDLMKAGERIHVLERLMNTREGITSKDDNLPQRFLTEPRADDDAGYTVPLRRMLKDYYRIWDYNAEGIPSERALEKLNISI
jgi:aldehyde:ferredoxin oxidoreductase